MSLPSDKSEVQGNVHRPAKQKSASVWLHVAGAIGGGLFAVVFALLIMAFLGKREPSMVEADGPTIEEFERAPGASSSLPESKIQIANESAVASKRKNSKKTFSKARETASPVATTRRVRSNLPSIQDVASQARGTFLVDPWMGNGAFAETPSSLINPLAPGSVQQDKPSPPKVKAAKQVQQKQEIPAAKAQAEALAKVKSIFKEAYRDQSPAGLTLRSQMLEKAADESKGNPVEKFVLLQEALAGYAKTGNASAATKTLAKLEAGFEIKRFDYRASLAKKISPNIKDQASAESFLLMVDRWVDDAFMADAYSEVKELMSIMKRMATSGRLATWASYLKLRSTQQRSLQKQYGKIENAYKAVRKSPSDKKSQLLIAEYLAFQKQDFDSAMPHFALSGNTELAKIARAKLKAGSSKLDVANALWKAAERYRSLERVRIKEYACRLYRELIAAKKVTGLDKSRIELLITEFQKVAWNDKYSSFFGSKWKVIWSGHVNWTSLVVFENGKLYVVAEGRPLREIAWVKQGEMIRILRSSDRHMLLAIRPDGKIDASKFDTQANKLMNKGLGEPN